VIAIERAGSALAAVVRHENRERTGGTPIAPPDQLAMGGILHRLPFLLGFPSHPGRLFPRYRRSGG
jgi:hypothetical protein